MCVGASTMKKKYKIINNFTIRAPFRPAMRQLNGKVTKSINTTNKEIVASIKKDEDFKLALQISSPSTFRSFINMEDNEGRTSNKLLRALRSYWNRAHYRATPFGIFSGVGVGTFSDETKIVIKNSPVKKIVTRPDRAWISHTIMHEQIKELNQIRVNPYLHRIGERFYITNNNIMGEITSNILNFRATPPITAAILKAEHGCSRVELIEYMYNKYDKIDRPIINGMVSELFKNNILIDSPHPESVIRTPKKYLSGDKNIEIIIQDIKNIQSLDDLQKQYNSLIERQKSITANYAGDYIAVDSSLNMAECKLDSKLTNEIAEIAGVLSSIASPHQRLPHLQDYEIKFIERYGAMAEIPLLDLLSEQLGLGSPQTYHNSSSYISEAYGAKNETREMLLINFIQEAMLKGMNKIILDQEKIHKLQKVVDNDSVATCPTLDIGMTIHIDPNTQKNIYSVTDLVTEGGRTFGRFTDLLASEIGEDVVKLPFLYEQKHFASERTVQLRYAATNAKASNVAGISMVADLEIALNCERLLSDENQVELKDILVGSAGDGFYLRWAKTGERIRVIQNHVLNPILAPNPARFLLEVSTDGYQLPSPFEASILRQLRYVPRIQYKNFILSLERWNLVPQDFSKEALHSFAIFSEEYINLQSSMKIPSSVVIINGDNKLPIESEMEDQLAIIWHHVKRAEADNETVTLCENISTKYNSIAFDEANNQYEAEFIFTALLLSDSNEAKYGIRNIKNVLMPIVKKQTNYGLFPTPNWISIELFTADELFPTLFTEIQKIISSIKSDISRWFFIRYSTGGAHVRLRVLPRNLHDLALFENLIRWANSIRGKHIISRFVVKDFHFEVNRYGGADCVDYAVDIFEKSSELAINLQSILQKTSLSEETINSFLVYATFSAAKKHSFEPNFEQSIDSHHPGRTLFRSIRKQLCTMVDPDGYDRDIAALDFLDSYENISFEYRSALRNFTDFLYRQSDENKLVVDVSDILHSFCHMHLNRCTGPSSNDEELSHVLLRLALSAIHQRRIAFARAIEET